MKTPSGHHLLPAQVPTQAAIIIYLVLASLAQDPHLLRDFPNRYHHIHRSRTLLPNTCRQGTSSILAHARCPRGSSPSITPYPRCCRSQKPAAFRPRPYTRPRTLAARTNTRLRLSLRPSSSTLALADPGPSSRCRHHQRRQGRRRQ